MRRRPSGNTPLRIVFVGSLLAHKGVHTAIEALGHLREVSQVTSVTLDIVGSGHPDYEDRLRHLVNTLQLNEKVTFHRPIPRTQLPSFLAKFDALVLPSIWEEPMALISQEAMASGLVVIATPCGGTKEILFENVNGLTFTAGDPIELAERISMLIKDPELWQRFSAAAMATAEAHFSLDDTLDELEAWLSELVT
jgi:glycosyltransferase involved in cell wall biosynthesis